MSGNPFEDANSLVGGLQDDYDRLTAAIPKLQETEKGIKEDIATLNKELVALQTKYDELKEEIAKRTNAYNTWQTDELKKLEDLKRKLSQERHDTENEQAAKEEKLREEQDRLTKLISGIKVSEEQTKKQQQEVDDQRKANTEWANRLSAKDTELKNIESDLVIERSSIETKKADVEALELKVKNTERSIAEAFKASYKDRNIARQILDNAKERIADLDAREDAVEQRYKLLDTKEQKLKQKEVALDDRRDVMIANGILK